MYVYIYIQIEEVAQQANAHDFISSFEVSHFQVPLHLIKHSISRKDTIPWWVREGSDYQEVKSNE